MVSGLVQRWRELGARCLAGPSEPQNLISSRPFLDGLVQGTYSNIGVPIDWGLFWGRAFNFTFHGYFLSLLDLWLLAVLEEPQKTKSFVFF